MNRIQRNLTGSKISTSSTMFVFFGPVGKTRWPPQPLIGWDIFDFFSETALRNSTKLDRKQDVNVLYQVCVFRADQKNKMAAPASDWLRYFRLLLWNRWTEFNETWQEARSQRLLPSLCFSGRSEKQDGRPSLWLAETFSTSSMKPLTVFKETWQEARSQCPLPRLCFSGRSEKQDGCPSLWLAEAFSTSSLKPMNRIQRHLTGSKISTSSTKFVFFGPVGKTRWPPQPLIGWDIFDFFYETADGFQGNLTGSKISMSSTKFVFFGPIGKTRWLSQPLIGWGIFDFFSETNEQNSTTLDRKQDLNVFYQVCVFRAGRKNQMAAPASDWLRPFRLLLWNRFTEFNETWQEVRCQCPLPSLCFSGRSEKQDGRPSLWLAETFSTFSLKPLYGIQRNLTGSKMSMSSTKFMFFGPIGKTRWLPQPLIGWDIFDFFSETALRNSTKLDRKQDVNVLYKVCVFRADRKNKMAAPASDWLRHFRLLLWNRWTEFNETWQEARSQRLLPSLCFSGRSEKQDGRPSLWLAETFSTSSMKPLTVFKETWQEARSQCPLPSLCFSGRSEKQDGCPSLWLAETFSTSSLKPMNRIQRHLTGSKISTSSTKFVFFGPVGKKRWPPQPLIGWDLFDFFSETALRNSTKLDRKQDVNVLYQVCVFRADRKKKMASPASDWLRQFRLLLWNRFTEFNETWQEARS